MSKQLKLGYYLGRLLFIIITIIYVFPVLWLVLISLKQEAEIFSALPTIFFSPTWLHYSNLFNHETKFLDYLWNSLVVSVSGTLLALLCGTMAGYACARFKLKVTRGFMLALLILRIIPAIAIVVPIYIFANRLGLLDQYSTLILVDVCVVLPLVTILAQNFILEVPVEIEEAAKLDGCNSWQIFWRITLPNALGGITALGIFSFILCWNEFIFALVLTGRHTTTLPIGIMSFFGDKVTQWGEVAAMGMVMMFPAAILTLVVQKYMVTGFGTGALKE